MSTFTPLTRTLNTTNITTTSPPIRIQERFVLSTLSCVPCMEIMVRTFQSPVFTICQYWAHSPESWCPKFAHISVQLNTNMVCGTIIPVATTYLLCICRFALNTSMFLTRKLSSACNLRKDKLLYLPMFVAYYINLLLALYSDLDYFKDQRINLLNYTRCTPTPPSTSST